MRNNRSVVRSPVVMIVPPPPSIRCCADWRMQLNVPVACTANVAFQSVGELFASRVTRRGCVSAVIQVVDDDPHTTLGKCVCVGTSDPAACTSDDGDLAGQVVAHTDLLAVGHWDWPLTGIGVHVPAKG